MPKFFLILITFFILLYPIPYTLYPTFAADPLPACNLQIETTPLTNPPTLFNNKEKTEEAKFTINVGASKATDIKQWKMEFECAALSFLNKKEIITPVGDNISTTVKNSGCEFSEGTRTLKVTAVISGKDVDQCRAVYTVKNADKLCQLTLSPDKGIISSTPLTVSGINLTSGSFQLFLDDKSMSGGRVDGPSFSGLAIPSSLKPGSHKVDLRKLGNLNQPLCTVSFIVGTPNQPGSVTSGGPGGAKTGVSSAVKSCDPKDPAAISTAIGCVHTNPVAFVKDLLKFLVGIAGGLAFLMMLLGAFQMITSAGNPDTLNAGRERFANAIIGLLFVIFAVLLLQIIGVDILRIPGFGK